MKKVFNILILSLLSIRSFAESRFPKPEFSSDYQTPKTTALLPDGDLTGWLSVTVLVIAMSLTAYLVLKKRRRKGVLLVLLGSLAFFGFYQKGCICVVGSVQNIVLGIFSSQYGVSISILLLFLLPLFFTLAFGRVFCGAACPLGGIQDILVLKPIKIPSWLEHCLGIIPYLYLGLAVLFAATGAGFIICQYDPFIAFFRFYGTFYMLLLGVGFLVVGAFIARPYCRFLCPYSVLLRWTSWLSKFHMTITPDECIQCRLCEDACPFGAILKPTAKEKIPETRDTGRKRLAIILLVTPLLMLVLGWGFSRLDVVFSRWHPTVSLAEQIQAEESGKTKIVTWESRSFRQAGKPIHELYDDALATRNKFTIGGWLLGLFMGLVLGMKWLTLSMRKSFEDYIPDRMKCLSCGRCFSYCPIEHQRLKELNGESVTEEEGQKND